MSNFQIGKKTGRRGLQTEEERKTNGIIWMTREGICAVERRGRAVLGGKQQVKHFGVVERAK